jgi:pimeloyl-ACP methyl ester carboxylesterase
MRYRIKITLIIFLILSGCQKEIITVGTNVSDTFYVENDKASMRVLVEGNTSSHIFILFVHGGPGAGSYIYDSDYIRENIENHYAMVYWDERNAGASQGSSNGKELTLENMTDDLKKVIQVVKARYGQDCSLFLIGHSFGGLLTSSFMTSGDNQSMVDGWIFADASHNYPLNDSLTRQMLLNYGIQQIAADKNREEWEEIVSYCNTYTGNFSYDESDQLETYATEAENYFDEVPKVDLYELLRKYAVKYNWPLTSMLVNYLYSTEAGINLEISKKEFSSSLYRVKVPVLILYGKYDFICPKALGDDFYNRIGSADKKIVISPSSGHSIMLQDGVLFCDEVDKFVALHAKVKLIDQFRPLLE